MSALGRSRILRKHDLAPLTRASTLRVRRALCDDFAGRCAYCLAHVERMGERHFEIDHHRPRAQGGTHEYRNLYWSCRACNGFKRDSWPSTTEQRNGRRYCDPCAEWDLGLHYVEAETGELVPVTPCGDYHVTVLHLNRDELVGWRRDRTRFLAMAAKARAALIRMQRAKQDPSELAILGELVAKYEREVSTCIAPIPGVPMRTRTKSRASKPPTRRVEQKTAPA
jgi:hypothetical protein